MLSRRSGIYVPVNKRAIASPIQCASSNIGVTRAGMLPAGTRN